MTAMILLGILVLPTTFALTGSAHLANAAPQEKGGASTDYPSPIPKSFKLPYGETANVTVKF